MKVGLAVLYGVLVTIIAWNAFVRTSLNWDGLVYGAIILSIEEHDPRIVHTRIYDAVGQEVNLLDNSQKVANPNLVDASSYRKDLACNWRHFYQQFGLYRVHVLYTGLSWIFYKLGLPVLQSTRAVSSFSYLAIAVVIFVWLQKLAPGIGGMLTSLVIMVQPPVLMLAQLSTSDCLSTAIVLWAMYLFLQYQAFTACCLLLLLSLLVRVDNLALLLAFLAVALVSERTVNKASLLRFLGWVIGAILVSLALMHLTKSYSWSTTFSHGLCSYMTTPNDTKAHISLRTYLHVLKYRFWCLPYTAQPYYALLGVMAIMLSRFKFGLEMLRRDPQAQVVVALLLGLAARFLIYPCAEDRYFIAYDLGIALAFIKTALTSRQNSNRAEA